MEIVPLLISPAPIVGTGVYFYTYVKSAPKNGIGNDVGDVDYTDIDDVDNVDDIGKLDPFDVFIESNEVEVALVREISTGGYGPNLKSLTSPLHFCPLDYAD